jgi:hypothetical protein
MSKLLNAAKEALRVLEQHQADITYLPPLPIIEQLRTAIEQEECLESMVEVDHADDDPGEHFMDDDGDLRDFEEEQWQAETTTRIQFYAEAATEEEDQANYEEQLRRGARILTRANQNEEVITCLTK